MSGDHACPVCKRTFHRRQHLREHRQAKRHHLERKASFWRRHPWKMAAMGSLLVVGGVWALDRGPSLPTIGSHWHANYVIAVCGERLPPRPASAGDIHTHGNGRIHTHPSTLRTAGENANLGQFFRSFGGTLRDSLLHVPRLGTFRNGDPCEKGGEGRVAVYVNGDRITDPAAYVPQNGDDVRIAFEPTTGRERTAPAREERIR